MHMIVIEGGVVHVMVNGWYMEQMHRNFNKYALMQWDCFDEYGFHGRCWSVFEWDGPSWCQSLEIFFTRSFHFLNPV